MKFKNNGIYTGRIFNSNARTIISRWKFFFIQDNARPHKYGDCKEFLESNYEPNLITMPPYSPDLNPIEKIWGIMKNKVYEIGAREYENRKELKSCMNKTWEEITKEEIRVHIDNLFNSRLIEVIRNGGKLL